MDEKMMVSLNVLNKAVKENEAKFAPKYAAKAGVSVEAAALPADMDFCALCVMVRPYINMAIKAMAFFAPAAISNGAKVFVATFYGTIYPMFCGK